MEQLHVRDGWRKSGLGSDPESQDESGRTEPLNSNEEQFSTRREC